MSFCALVTGRPAAMLILWFSGWLSFQCAPLWNNNIQLDSIPTSTFIGMGVWVGRGRGVQWKCGGGHPKVIAWIERLLSNKNRSLIEGWHHNQDYSFNGHCINVLISTIILKIIRILSLVSEFKWNPSQNVLENKRRRRADKLPGRVFTTHTLCVVPACVWVCVHTHCQIERAHFIFATRYVRTKSTQSFADPPIIRQKPSVRARPLLRSPPETGSVRRWDIIAALSNDRRLSTH